MTTSKAIEVIYELSLTSVGPSGAKQTLSGILCNVIDELESSGLPVSEENISKRMTFIAEEFMKAAKRGAA